MRKTICLLSLAIVLTSTAASINVPFLSSGGGGGGGGGSSSSQLNIYSQIEGSEDFNLIDSSTGEAVYLSLASQGSDGVCGIRVVEKDSTLDDTAYLTVEPGVRIQSPTDFPSDSEYEVLDEGTENTGGEDSGANVIYSNLGTNPDFFSTEGAVGPDFPIKCLMDGEYAEWQEVSPASGEDFCSTVQNPNLYAECSGGGYTTGPDYETGSGGDEGSESSSGKVDCSEVDNPNLYAECTGGGYTSAPQTGTDSTTGEVDCTEVENPNLYERCTGGGYTGAPEGGSSNVIEQDLTRAEWAALASVDPMYITDENATNLNEREMSFEEAVSAARDAAAANGWLEESGRHLDVLAEISQDSRERDLEGVTGPGQGMKAANTNLLVTEGTASPYESDGCYANRDFEPVEYGELDNSFQPASFSGPDWNPGEYQCPAWMDGGERIWYQGDLLSLDWSKLEEIQSSAQDTGSDSGSGETAAVTVAEEVTGFSWKSYCSENADSIGINAEDGINADEAATCVQPCWGAGTDQATPHNENVQCGQLVRNFCSPYFEYQSGTNTCRVSN